MAFTLGHMMKTQWSIHPLISEVHNQGSVSHRIQAASISIGLSHHFDVFSTHYSYSDLFVLRLRPKKGNAKADRRPDETDTSLLLLPNLPQFLCCASLSLLEAARFGLGKALEGRGYQCSGIQTNEFVQCTKICRTVHLCDSLFKKFIPGVTISENSPCDWIEQLIQN